MGACYSVELKVNIKDEKGVIEALNNHMNNDTSAVYKNTVTETFDDLMRVLLADHQRKVYIYKEKKWCYYENDFDASYGWERVMVEWFNVMTPFLGNGSTLVIYIDNDGDEFVIKDGKCILVR